jgi:pimeloyl-ACP methyl ester carboxylesterase
MAKMSQTVKEIIQVVVFLLVLGIVLMVFLIYPLNRTKAFSARPDIDDFNADSVPINDPTLFLELGAAVDTFRVDADGLTSLACLYLTPLPDSGSTDSAVAIQGTAILLHNERRDRTAMIPLASSFLESGYAVCLYDQRASGFSTAAYHSDGEYEASDLTEIVAYLAIRDRVHRPFVAVGEAVGADAVLLVAAEEERFDAVVAIKPYVTSERWLDMLIEEHDMCWIPFSHTLLEFWYELRSGYAPTYRGSDDLSAPTCRTLLLLEESSVSDAEVVAYLETAETGVQWSLLPTDPDSLRGTILDFVQLDTEESGDNQE